MATRNDQPNTGKNTGTTNTGNANTGNTNRPNESRSTQGSENSANKSGQPGTQRQGAESTQMGGQRDAADASRDTTRGQSGQTSSYDRPSGTDRTGTRNTVDSNLSDDDQDELGRRDAATDTDDRDRDVNGPTV